MEKTEITFTGDISFDRYMDGKYADKELLSKKVLNFCQKSEHLIANVEGVILSEEDAKKAAGQDTFCHYMKSGVTEVLKRIGADIWTLANNHTMDLGEDGLKSTVKFATQSGAKIIGAGENLSEASKPIYINEAGGIGIFSVGYIPDCVPAKENSAGVFSMNEYELIEKTVKKIKSRCRWCIIVVHGGEEFTNLPNPYIRNRYIKYLEYGADIIVAHHTHTPMNFEFFPNKAIFYSLGNFIFDTDYQRAQDNTDRGVLLKLKLTETDFSFEALGVKTDRETERIKEYALPEIFTEINGEEYEKLIPLSAKAFIEAEKKRNIYLHQDKFGNFSEQEWKEYLLSEDREEYIKGETMDFSQIFPIAEAEEKREWQTAKNEAVKEYIKSQIRGL